MTCGTHQCCLCERQKVNGRWRHPVTKRFIRGWELPRLLPSPYYTDGHLTNGKSLKSLKANTPHRQFCPGCLERIGVKVP